MWEGLVAAGPFVYDRVWINYRGMIERRMVYAIVHEMNLMKDGIDTKYFLTPGDTWLGASFDKCTQYKVDEIHATKEAAIDAFVKANA
jgi:hypothetical protein